MTSRQVHPLVVVAAVLLLVVPIVVVGGLYVRATVFASLKGEEVSRIARASIDAAVRAQLDEETGVRGYAATGDRIFLEPYRQADAVFDRDLDDLRAALANLAVGVETARDVDALATTNEEWQTSVAAPVIARTTRNARDTQLLGKRLVDRYRATADRILAVVVRRRIENDAAAVDAVDRIGVFTVAATALVSLIALAFGVQQRRLQRRVDEERRSAAEANAAYETEKRISDTLQEAFMLKPLPRIPSVRLSAIYLPATEETLVGGDWYDGIELDGGRVMFAIGDVAGHGLDAAVAMNRTRQAMLGAALAGHEPAALLQRVNEELLRDGGRMVTAVCGYADPRTFAFTYATAGHPPPVLIEPGRPPRLLACGGVPLAVMEGAHYRSHTIQTVPGAMLVLYTDGAVEHSRDVLNGEQVLLSAVRDAVESGVEDPAVHIRETIFGTRKVADDVAIVTLTFGEDNPTTARMRLGDGVEVSASGPEAGPGAITSIGPRSFRRLIVFPERKAS